MCVFASALLGGLLYGLNRSATGWLLFQKLTIWSLGVGIATLYARWLLGTKHPSMFSSQSERGDNLAFVGLILAFLINGFLYQLSDTQTHAGVESEGKQAGEFIQLGGPTVDHKTIDLSDLRGRIVLVDFWATWCGPCMAELPNIRQLYHRFHDSGFEIVGVSLDQDRKALETHLAKYQDAWPQIFFDDEKKQGWQNPIAQQFEVRGIPYTMLIDREGRLIADHLRGSQVKIAVANALGVSLPILERVPSLQEIFVGSLRGVVDGPFLTLFALTVLVPSVLITVIRFGWPSR